MDTGTAKNVKCFTAGCNRDAVIFYGGVIPFCAYHGEDGSGRVIEMQRRDADDIVKFRALAKRAAELGQRVELADNLNADQILDELAAMHQED